MVVEVVGGSGDGKCVRFSGLGLVYINSFKK